LALLCVGFVRRFRASYQTNQKVLTPRLWRAIVCGLRAHSMPLWCSMSRFAVGFGHVGADDVIAKNRAFVFFFFGLSFFVTLCSESNSAWWLERFSVL
jgi:hypothetical protein